MHQLEVFQSLFKICPEIANGSCGAVLASRDERNTGAHIQTEW